ncbi:FAD binding domain-containing protein [Pseudonocardia spinosispora]|uniref:FAD binding domain-containing protein n=1 Tax=Pseudonocardia spinosispora TaxID=103441 RepID=UPI0003FAC142|nr:FAD binding domain-containing protein [Pseudonocardia spinosispora]
MTSTESVTRLHRPDSLDEACRLLTALDMPMIYGGGTAVQILLKQGVLFASDLVDLSRIAGLDRIDATENGIRVGAMVTLRRMETDAQVHRTAPLAARVYGHVANPRVRNTASVGGNLAHGDYRLDPPTALLVLDAQVELTSTAGSRKLPIREFFTGFQQTAIAHGELVSAVHVPRQPSPHSAFVKLSSLSVNDWPCASAAALVVPVGRRRDNSELRLGLGALASRPEFLSLTLPSDTGLHDAVDAAARAAAEVIDPIPDIRGSADFKRRLGLVAVRDAVRQAWESAQRATGDHDSEEGSDAQRASRRRWWRGR